MTTLDEPQPRTAKEILQAVLDVVSDDATWEDILDEISFQQKIERGLAEADSGQLLSEEEARARLGKWLK